MKVSLNCVRVSALSKLPVFLESRDMFTESREIVSRVFPWSRAARYLN